MFQSTRPRGARHDAARGFHQNKVSIHAPTRGATIDRLRYRYFHTRFNPRAHAGRDICISSIDDAPYVFQSTRPRGARLVLTSHPSTMCSCFNPRAHAGRDSSLLVFISSNFCFNPRAHAGRDLRRPSRLGQGGVSIHAPTRGATQVCWCSYLTYRSFCRLQHVLNPNG